MIKKIAIIPGDGIGIDVIREAVKVLEAIKKKWNTPIEWVEFDFGAEKYLKTGITMPPEQVEDFRKNYDAILLGAVGDPRVPDMTHARDILLGLRFQLDLYVNYRPVQLIDEKYCPLKNKTRDDVNFVIFRENTEGAYVGMGGIFKRGTADEIAVQEDINTRKGVERIITYAFEWAKKHKKKRVLMSDKSNALRFGHDIWQRVFTEISGRYPEIEASTMFVDALTMQMIKAPEQFDVIVTCNMFGDIIADLGAQLQGGLGLAASGNIHPGKVSLFEPIHGSAPKYAGKNVANPLAAILTLQLLLEYLNFENEGKVIHAAVRSAVELNKTTKDLAGKLGTSQVGDFIVQKIMSEYFN
jgi:3-isopropylmalate dehydrogenase